jgi:hypothetical protein
MLATDTLTRSMIETLPNFKWKSSKEASAACPFCNEGEDRFLFWPEKGNYYCRRCEVKGFVDDAPGIQLDPAILAEWKAKEEERKAQEQSSKIEKIDTLNTKNNVERYHQQLTDRSWWYSKGVDDATINRFKLGYTTNCPTAPGEESYTIPVTYQNKLYNIRHRLANADNGNKYRPEMAGLPATMFNADVLSDDFFVTDIVLVEGEIKAMVLQQYGFDAVGIPGANTFKDKWVKLFYGITKPVYVALDPGVENLAVGIWQRLSRAGVDVRLCYLPVKPDDFFVLYEGTPSDFFYYLQLGQRGHCD